MLKFIFTTTALLLITLASPMWAQSWPDGDRSNKVSRPDYSHLEYFGFYASAMGPWNFTGELAPWTNLTWIHVGSWDFPEAAIDDFMERLQQAQDAGVQATLSIESLLFTSKAGELRDEEETIELLTELRARIEAAGLVDTVAMIYPKDEPFRNYVDERDPDFFEQYVTGEIYEEIHADLLQANSTVKLVFPDTPIGVILSGFDLHHPFFSIPENYDWVGFDCYDTLFGGCDFNMSFTEHYDHLLDHMQPHQRLMAIGETWATEGRAANPDWPSILLSRLRHHYEMALSDPRFIAFIPFIWSNDTDNPSGNVGLNRFPEIFDDGITDEGTNLVHETLSIGFEIKNQQAIYPNLAWDETEDDKRRPDQNIDAAVTGVDAEGVISGWAIDRSLPHKNLRVQFLLRNSAGKVIWKSPISRTALEAPDLGSEGAIGRHGFRVPLPLATFRKYGIQTSAVDIVVFKDGRWLEAGWMESVRIEPVFNKGNSDSHSETLLQ